MGECRHVGATTWAHKLGNLFIDLADAYLTAVSGLNALTASEIQPPPT